VRHPPPAWALAAALALVTASGARAQARDPLRGVVGDLRLVSVTLPSVGGWVPALPADAVVPGRGFGVEAGAHVLVGPGRYRRLGIGFTGLAGQGRATGLDRRTCR
jgi:hypothetical protein